MKSVWSAFTFQLCFEDVFILWDWYCFILLFLFILPFKTFLVTDLRKIAQICTSIWELLVSKLQYSRSLSNMYMATVTHNTIRNSRDSVSLLQADLIWAWPCTTWCYWRRSFHCTSFISCCGWWPCYSGGICKSTWIQSIKLL